MIGARNLGRTRPGFLLLLWRPELKVANVLKDHAKIFISVFLRRRGMVQVRFSSDELKIRALLVHSGKGGMVSVTQTGSTLLPYGKQ